MLWLDIILWLLAHWIIFGSFSGINLNYLLLWCNHVHLLLVENSGLLSRYLVFGFKLMLVGRIIQRLWLIFILSSVECMNIILSIWLMFNTLIVSGNILHGHFHIVVFILYDLDILLLGRCRNLANTVIGISSRHLSFGKWALKIAPASLLSFILNFLFFLKIKPIVELLSICK